jgi:hypothetical protein
VAPGTTTFATHALRPPATALPTIATAISVFGVVEARLARSSLLDF